MLIQGSNKEDFVQKMLDRVGYGHDDRRRTKLQKVMQQHRVLKYIENRAEKKGAPVDGLAYEFAMKANRRQRKLSLLAKQYVRSIDRIVSMI